MKNFPKRVRLVSGSRAFMFYPLSDGQDMFVQGQEYLIKNGKDLDRLLSRGDFECLDLDPVEVAPLATEPETTSFVAKIKNEKKKDEKEEVTN